MVLTSRLKSKVRHACSVLRKTPQSIFNNHEDILKEREGKKKKQQLNLFTVVMATYVLAFSPPG